MAASIAVSKKIFFFAGGRRQEILKIEICTWKENKCFPNVYKIVQ